MSLADDQVYETKYVNWDHKRRTIRVYTVGLVTGTVGVLSQQEPRRTEILQANGRRKWRG